MKTAFAEKYDSHRQQFSYMLLEGVDVSND